jgi:hypothetical protein
MASMDDSWVLPGIIGCRVVGVLHSTPFMTDFGRRRADVEQFFDPATEPAAKAAILDQYGVSNVLARRSERGSLAGLEAILTPVHEDSVNVLYLYEGARSGAVVYFRASPM